MTEPVAFFDPQEKGFYWAKPTKITAPTIVDVEPLALYTQRTWVGLTIEEREQIQQECFGKVPHHVAFAHAIEAKLKEKNT
jgi:hypothetical protein